MPTGLGVLAEPSRTPEDAGVVLGGPGVGVDEGPG